MNEPYKQCDIYVDGSCQQTYGGWAYIIIAGDIYYEDAGNAYGSTNNRMELTAAIKSLRYMNRFLPHGTATVFTDSRYVSDGITKYIYNWHLDTRKNKDLWQQLYELNLKLSVKWQWVRGHNYNRWNEYVDQIASHHALQLKRLA